MLRTIFPTVWIERHRVHVAVPVVLLWLYGLFLLLGPLYSATQPMPISYNEGWNASHVQTVREGRALYGEAPRYHVANYPPVSFRIVAAVSGWFADANLAGRAVSTFSFAGVILCVGLIVWRLTGNVWAAWLGAALVIPAIVDGGAIYVASNEPQMLGHLFILAGLFLYVSARSNPAVLAVVSALFVLGGFVKHNLITFPLVVTLHLLFRSRRALVHWSGWSLGWIAVLLAFSILSNGPYFWQHFLMPRQVQARFGVLNASILFTRLELLLLTGGFFALLFLVQKRHRMFTGAWVVGSIVGIGFACGSGVASNVFFDAIFASCILVGLGLDFLLRSDGTTAGVRILASGFLPAALLLSAAADFPQTYREKFGPAFLAHARDYEAAYREMIAYVRRQPGPVICEDLLLCFHAGQPIVYDPYFVTERVKTDNVPEAEVAGRFQRREFTLVQFSLKSPEERVTAAGRLRWPPGVMAALLEHYREDRRVGTWGFYVPN